MSSARAPAGSGAGNGLPHSACQLHGTAPAPNGTLSLLCVAWDWGRSPAELFSRGAGAALRHSYFASQGNLRLLTVFLRLLGNCPHPSASAPGTLSCLAFLQVALVRSSCGVASGCCSVHSVRFGRLETNRSNHKRESDDPPGLKLGFNSRHSPEKGSFTRWKGHWFLSPAWTPDLGQPHLVSCLLRKLLLLFFAWLLNPFPSL